MYGTVTSLGRTGLTLFVLLLGCLLLVSPACSRAAPAPEPVAPPSLTASFPQELPLIAEAPDFELTDQDGARIRLSDHRGKIVLMNFIYTSCPTACQLQNLDFRNIRNGLDEASRLELALVSMSFDPEVDTPQVLKEYAQARGFYGPGWHFLTGSPEEVAAITDIYGVVYQLVPPEEHMHPDGEAHPHGRGFSHMNQAFLIDREGIVRKAYLGVQIGSQVFAVDEMIADIRSLLVG